MGLVVGEKWSRRAVRTTALVASLLLAGIGGATPAPAAPRGPAPATPTRASGGPAPKDSVVHTAFTPAAGLPALGAVATARVNVAVLPSAAAAVRQVRVVLIAQGAATLRGPSTVTVTVPASDQVTVDAPYSVAAAAPGTLDAQVTALDARSSAIAVQMTHLWVEGFAEGVSQSANGPSDAIITRLQRLHTSGALSDSAYSAEVSAAVAGTAKTQSIPVGVAGASAPTTAITGTIRYQDSAGNPHPVRRAPVEVRNAAGMLATTMTDDMGKYSASVDPAGQPVFARAYSKSTGFTVQTTTGLVYFVDSATVAPAANLTINVDSVRDDATHDTNGALNVADAMVTGVDYTKRLRGSKFPDITVQFPDGTGTNFGGTVGHILRNDRYDWDVNLHEYGHFFADQSGIQDSTLTGDVSHGFGDNLATRYNKAKGEPLAWREGVATYFSLTAQQVMGTAAFGIPNVGDTHYTDTEEGGGDLDVDIASQAGGASLGEDNELSVMRTLWDIYDTPANPGDDRGVALGDQAVYNALKGAAAKTMSAGYAALVNGEPERQVADIGCIVSEQKIAPTITAPADKSIVKVGMPPTITWDANGDGAGLPSDKFTVQFFDATFGGPLFESPEQAAKTFTPTMDQWKTVLDGAGPVVNVVVKGTQSAAPSTGPYTSCNVRLIPEKVDLVFAIDTTGSMSPYINGVVAVANNVVDTLASSGADFRIGVVDYKDVDSTLAGCPPDYDAVTDLAFSADKAAIVGSLNSLLGKVGGGCDIPEDVLSGIKRAVDFPWRNGVRKAIIVMGDAPGHDPEAHSGLTSASVIAAAMAVDPADIYPILVGGDPSATSFMTNLANGTGGHTFDSNASNVGQALLDAINAIVSAPTADAGGPYHGFVGTPITFDGSGSISLTGNIVKWEWDFTNDGSYDATSTTPTIQHTYPAPFHGRVALRVTDDATPPHTAIATADVDIEPTTTPTTTTLVANPPSPQTFGTAVTFTATVHPPASGAVSFVVDGTPVGTVPLSASTASLLASALGPGSHQVTANYEGTTAFAPSSATLTDVVGCGRTISGNQGAVVAGAGATCILGAHLSGAVIVPAGASVAIENSQIAGSITASGSGSFRLCGSTVGGAVSVGAAGSLVVIGDPGDAHCASNTIAGTLLLQNDTHGVEAIGNTVGGLVSSGNSGPGPFPGDTTTIAGNHR